MKNAILVAAVSSCFLGWGAMEPSAVGVSAGDYVDVAIPYDTVCHVLSDSYPAGQRRDPAPAQLPLVMALLDVEHEETAKHYRVRLTLGRTIEKHLLESGETSIEHVIRRVDIRVTPRLDGKAARLSVYADDRLRNPRGIELATDAWLPLDLNRAMERCAAWVEFQAELYAEPQ